LTTTQERGAPFHSNELAYFAQSIDHYLKEAKGTKEYFQTRIYYYDFDIVPNPFLKGLLLSVLTRNNSVGEREVSLFPLVQNDDQFGPVGSQLAVIPETFLPKSRRVVMQYSGQGEDEELVKFSLSDFELITFERGIPGIEERSISYDLNNESNEVSVSELGIHQYIRRSASRRKMFVLSRAVKCNGSYNDKKLFVSIDSSKSEGVYLIKDGREYTSPDGQTVIPYTFYQGGTEEIPIIKPRILGEEVSNIEEMLNYHSIATLFEGLGNTDLYITEGDINDLRRLGRGGISLPVFSD
jgi:hypothetical protein